MELACPFHPAIVQVLLAGRRTGESIGPVEPGGQAKKLVAVGAFFEGPCSVNGRGELTNHGAQQTAGTEDQLRPTLLLRPDDPGGNRLFPTLEFSQPVLEGITEEPEGRAG